MFITQVNGYCCFIELTCEAGIGSVDMLIVNEMIGQIGNRYRRSSDQLVKVNIVIAVHPAGLHPGIKM
jgi:hypothetical protein